jgi:16S rRNA (adenine(1408)-N(1))-methyltransferase
VLFVIANASALPSALAGLAAQITINFPWGSLLRGLVEGEPALLTGLHALARPGAVLETRLNGGALREAGWTLAEGGVLVQRALRAHGFQVGPGLRLDATALRACPTTWAKRLAYGRDPQALYLRASYAGTARMPAIAGALDAARS